MAGPKVKQINKSNDQIAVQANKETTIGSQWIVSQKSGAQCVFEVVQSNTQSAVLETDDCDLSQIRVGQSIEKSLFASTTNQSRTTGKGPAWLKDLDGFSLVAYYTFADDLPYKGQGGQNITANSETSFGFGAEYAYDLTRATDGLPLSLTGGLTYELSREIESYSANGVTQKAQGAKPNFSLWLAYVNGQYNLTKRIGAFFGVNYSFPVESDFGDVNLKSALGYQLGATARLTDNLAVDALYRWINIDATNGVSDVSLDGLTVRGRYIF